MFFYFSFSSYSQITGTVFRDYNLDGSFQPGAPNNEIGIPGIIINAYDATNTIIATTNSAIDGTYTLPFSVPVRVEFEFGTPTLCVDSNADFSSVALNGENIRFVNASTANVDYAIQNPEDFQVTANPNIYISKFNRGDPLAGGLAGSANSFLGYPYSFSGLVTGNILTTADQTGSVWGVAYSKQSNKVFTSAFLKRHSGYGPMGSGGIYMLDPVGGNFVVTQFYDMDANGHRTRAASNAVPYGIGTSYDLNSSNTIATYLGPIDPISGLPEGLGVIGVNGVGGRGLTNSTSGQWYDATAMDQVAKVGIGDIDISEDGKFLFLTNLYSRSVYRLELDNAFDPQSVIAVDSFALPNIAVTNGLLRCFGLAVHRGKVYIGAVSTGENGGQNILNGATDLFAYVFEMTNPNTATAAVTATPIISFPLNYQKGGAIGSGNGSDQWYPWNNDTGALLPTGEETLPTPILSDIEFSDRGDLIMDFCDRSGHQFGIGVLQNLAVSTDFSAFDIGGDVLIAGIDCNTGNYTLENNGSFTSNGTVFNGGVGNGEGIGGGEFFYQDEWIGFHNETSVGSAAVLRGRGEVLVSLMDPINAFSNGTGKFNTTTAITSGNAQLATTTEFGKGNSLGDIEVAGDAVQLQIGNRVWLDNDFDGIQDPGEPGINNVSIDLYADFNSDNVPDGAALGNTLTNGDGNWYFDKSNVLDGDPTAVGSQPGPVPGRNYLIRINAANWSGGFGIGALQFFTLSPSNIGGNGQADVRDNDATLISNIPTIVALTKRSGENIHNFDFGFIPCDDIAMNDVFLDCNVDSSIIGPTATNGQFFQWNPPTGLSDPTLAQPIASPGTTTAYTLTVNGLCEKTIIVYVDNTAPYANAGPARILDCTERSVLLGTEAIPGHTYSWLPIETLDNPNIAQPTASPLVTTNYTLTVVGSNGCVSKAEALVNIDKCCSRIIMPNSFTPNGDSKNDKFGPVILENTDSYYMVIYNRWGERIFESNSFEMKWDGTYKGKVCDVDTYFYIVTYNCENFSEPKMLKGDISLLR